MTSQTRARKCAWPECQRRTLSPDGLCHDHGRRDGLPGSGAHTAADFRPLSERMGVVKGSPGLAAPPDGTRTRMHDLLRLTPKTRALLRVIRRSGGRPVINGGSVRDALLGDHNPKDIDIEVYGNVDIDDLAARLHGNERWVDTVGASFGVLKVRDGAEDFDISLPRRDNRTGTGHRGFTTVVDPTISYTDATSRRDFTVNALLWDPETEELIDCWEGERDIEDGVLRAVSPAFAEDPLRVLRGVQFAARFGWSFDDGTAELCRSLHDEYYDLPTERIWAEWHKALTKGSHFSNMLTQLHRAGWSDHFPELSATRGVEQDARWHPEGDVWTHIGLAADESARLIAERDRPMSPDDRFVVTAAALLHDLGKVTHTQHVRDAAGNVEQITSHGHAEAGVGPADDFMRSIGTPDHLRHRVTPIIAEHMCATTSTEPNKRNVSKLVRRLAPATIGEWALVCKSDKAGRGPGSHDDTGVDGWVAVAREINATVKPPKPVITGRDLIAAGLEPGPAFKPLLERALAAQDDQQFTDRDGALAWLAAEVGGPGQ